MQITGAQLPSTSRPQSAGLFLSEDTGLGDVLRDVGTSAREMKDRVVADLKGLAGRANFKASHPDYTGPEDGLSHPNFKAQAYLKPVNRWVMNKLFRIEVEGEENLPKDGKNLYCPTHPSVGDPSLMSAVLPKGDYRFVANVILFKGKGGPVITAMGAFPVDRDNPSRATIQHGVDLVKEGTPFIIFPEGGISENPNQINPLKRGAAYFAVHGEADRIVPIGIHFSRDTEERPIETLKSWAVATALVGGTLASCYLGPAAQSIAGAVTGALTGAYATSTVARAFVKNKKWFNPFPSKLAGLGGGLVGGIAGGIIGFLSPGMQSGTVSQMARTLTAGFCAQQLLERQSHRDIAHIKFGRPIDVHEYQNLSVTDSAKVDALTNDLHAELGALKAEMSGVPYDPHVPRIRPGTGIPVLPNTPAPLYFQAMAEEELPKNSCHPRGDRPRAMVLGQRSTVQPKREDQV